MKIGLAGYDEWTRSCRTLIATEWEIQLLSPESIPAHDLPLLISGSSGEWYPLVNGALRSGCSILLGNPGSWSFHDLKRLQEVADESGVEMYTYRPWRWTLPLEPTGRRIVKIAAQMREGEKWKPYFGHAVDRVLNVLGTDNLLRADASRGSTSENHLSLLLVHLRFQNGSVAQISLERATQPFVSLNTPLLRSESRDLENDQTLNTMLTAFLSDPSSLPTLTDAISGRKIEEKVFSILRTA